MHVTEKSGTSSFAVGKRLIGEGQPSFLIAEIGNNHNGSAELARRMVDECVTAGVDAVKFQMRDMDSLYGQAHRQGKSGADLGAQYTLDLLAKYQLTNEEMLAIFDYCRERGIIAFCTPWDLKSVDVLERYGLPLYKTASADLTNHPLLQRIAATGKPMICSSGMSTEQEIRDAIAVLDGLGAQYAVLHCNSTYPTPFKDVNLGYLRRLQQLTRIVGYSGHERGIHIPIAAVALGAKVIEKHFTLDKSMEGVDHRVSLLPGELAEMVQRIRELEAAMGSDGGPRALSQGELINRENLGKSIVVTRAVEIGEKLRAEDLTVRSPGQGLPPYMLPRVVGVEAKRKLEAGDVLFKSDLPAEERVRPRAWHFRRPWGIPVRYHDAERFLALTTPDFIEFHLSYGDMREDPRKFLKRDRYEVGFTVHAPELFEGDHLLDLSSSDPAYLQRSMDNMRRTIDIAVELKRYFPKTARPFIIATVGGFTTTRALTREERAPLYEALARNLRALDNPGVEILPQTTAPFPWHMGGQQYQNLLLLPDEIAWFCREFGYRVCLDVSHSHLACNHLGIEPARFYEQVAPHTAHLHLGDSRGVDGEGLQIGDGEMDFPMMTSTFNRLCPDAWFIPEIWQGHKNDGEGFWIALNRLEGML
jgi:N-acetylneuraminate synthase